MFIDKALKRKINFALAWHKNGMLGEKKEKGQERVRKGWRDCTRLLG